MAAIRIHANTCLLKPVHGYPDSNQCEHGLRLEESKADLQNSSSGSDSSSCQISEN